LNATLSVDAIDYVNAHGTGTVANDNHGDQGHQDGIRRRSQAPVDLLDESMHGHALGASGSLELIAVVEAIRHGIVPPTINIEELDPECDLDRDARLRAERPIRAPSANAFAFGGTNAVVAVKRFEG